jgi:lipopolysaccharide export LptBFGC system permease protein LptF
MLKVIDRATIVETLLLMGAGVLLIAGIFFGTSEFKYIFSLIFNIGMLPATALSISALQMPGTIVQTLPTAVIVSTALVLLRRGYDGELIGLAVSGVNPVRAFIPLLCIALGASLFSFALSEYVVPKSRRLSNGLLYIGVLNSELPRARDSMTLLRSDSDTGPINHVFLIGKYLKQNLENVVVLDFSKSGEPKVIWSKKGVWKTGRWILLDGNMYEIGSVSEGRKTMHFDQLSFDAIGMKIDEILSQGPLPQELPASALREKINQLEKRGVEPPASMLVRYYRRYSQPASCLLVSLAALPLLVVQRRRNLHAGFAYIGLVVLFFFLMQQSTISLADHGRLNPLLAAWLPAIFIAGLGIAGFCLRQVSIKISRNHRHRAD